MDRNKAKGQGLVEYAIVILLVAIVAIAVLTLIGFVNKRGIGVVAGALGASHNETNAAGTRITIDSAECLASTSQGKMGIWVLGTSNISPSELTGSTDTGLFSSAEAEGAGFKYNPLIGNTTDLGKCPKGVVIQAKDGTTALAPLIAKTVP